MPRSVLSPLFGLLIAFGLSAALVGCGGSSSEHADGDSGEAIGEEEAEPEAEAEEEAETSPACVLKPCRDGLYCDQNDGLCKACTEDAQCGAADPTNGIEPLCRAGRCEKVTCGALFAPTVPEFGVGLGSGTLRPGFDEYGRIVPQSNAVFVVGAVGLNAQRYPDAAAAGFNLVVSSSACCANQDEFTYHLDTVLGAAKRADLYAGVFAAWPQSSFPEPPTTLWLTWLSDRSQSAAHLLWIGGSYGAGETPDTSFAAKLRKLLKDDLGDTKPLAYLLGTGTDATAIAPQADLLMATLDENAAIPSAEVARMKNQAPDKPLWVRLLLSQQSSEQLTLLSYAAILSGAGGVLFDFADESNPAPKAFSAAKKTAEKLHANSALWLSPRSPGYLTVQNAPSTLLAVHYLVSNKIHVSYLLNLSSTATRVSLLATPTQTPYCRAIIGSETKLSLTRETSFSLDLPPTSLTQLQLTEASSPEGTSR